MKPTLFATLLVAGSLWAQTPALPVPDVAPAKDIPGAKELPDPSMTYKVVFDIGTAADKVDEVNPMLTAIARYVNTLAKAGVAADHRRIAVVIHQKGTPIILNNDAWKAKYEGKENPNIPMIRALAKAGVDFRVCGQAVLANKIDPKTIQPEIELDLWALTTIVNLQMRGYVKVGGN